MNFRDNTYFSTGLTDFSSVFMRATSDDDAVRPEKNDVIQEQVVSENRNLSNIITHIRDEGSARLQPKKTVRQNRNNIQRTPAASISNTVPLQQPKSRPMPVEKEDVMMTAFQTNEENIQNKRKPQWLMLGLSLAFTVVVIMGLNLYRLNVQANEMESVLNSFEEQLDELSDTQEQSSDTLVRVSKMKKDLKGLKQEIQTVKSDYAEFDNKLAQSSTHFLEPQKQEIATVKQNVSELEGSLENTRTEMSVIKAAMDKVKGMLVVEKETASSDGWVVNLASLSSKEQAQVGVATLVEAGIVPVVQEIEVNGATVYRLSVEGFSTHKEAILFISKAKELYSFDGGWVRPG